MWVYRSPIGNIYIKYLPSERAYGTIYNGTVWECCDTAQAAADNVYVQVTGITEWDTYDTTNIDIPSDLSEWEKI